jgi:hypothetical protein
MGRGLTIVLVEGRTRPIASRFHAEEDHAPSVREKRAGLPGHLVRDVEIEVAQAGAVGVDDRGAPLRREETPPAALRDDGFGWGLRQPENVATAAPATLGPMNW